MGKHHPSQKNRTLVHQSSVQTFSGPLPHPDILRKFEEVVPGAAERIIAMAETQSNHRQSLERRVIQSDISRSKWGQILGFVISIAGLVASVVISIYGNPYVGGLLGTGTLVALVSVFMYGAKSRREEREEKAER